MPALRPRARTHGGRRPGNVPWNRARFAVARHVARVADPSVADTLEPGVEQVAAEVTKLQGDRALAIAWRRLEQPAAARAADREGHEIVQQRPLAGPVDERAVSEAEAVEPDGHDAPDDSEVWIERNPGVCAKKIAPGELLEK